MEGHDSSGPTIVRLIATGKLHLSDDGERTVCGTDAKPCIPETTTDKATAVQMENLCDNCVQRWGQRGPAGGWPT